MKNKIIILFFILFSKIVFAAQDVTIVVDNAGIQKEPKEKAEIIEYLPIGTEVRVSANPIPGGWYKIRARSGEYGWIHEGYISLPKRSDPLLRKSEKNEKYSENRRKPERIPPRNFSVRPFFGFQFGSTADLNDIFSFDQFQSLNYLGAELSYKIGKNFGILFRAEGVFKDVVAKESITGVTYVLGLRSYPIMGGLEFNLVSSPPLQVNVAALGGIAFRTSFTSQALNLSAPNSVTISQSPVTALFRFNVTRPLGRTFALFFEAGYRYLLTSELSTAGAVNTNGGQVFLKNGSYQNRIIDLSGYALGGGVSLNF